MDEHGFVKWATDQGAMAVLFLVGAYFYRRDILSRETSALQYTQLWQAQTETLMRVVVENTTSNIHVVKTVDALHRRLDREQGARNQSHERN